MPLSAGRVQQLLPFRTFSAGRKRANHSTHSYSIYRRVVDYYNGGSDAFDMRKPLAKDKDRKTVRANGENVKVQPSDVCGDLPVNAMSSQNNTKPKPPNQDERSTAKHQQNQNESKNAASVWSTQSVAGSTVTQGSASERTWKKEKEKKSHQVLQNWLAETPAKGPWNALADSRRYR